MQSVHITVKGFLVMPFLCYVLQVHDCIIGIMGEKHLKSKHHSVSLQYVQVQEA